MRKHWEPLIVKDVYVEHDWRVLYRGRRMIPGWGKHDHLVEVSVTNNKFYILALDVHTHAAKLIDLYYRQGQRLMKHFKGNYKKMVKQLRLKYKKLIFKDL